MSPLSQKEGSSRSLPNQTPCLSYWQRTTRAFPYLHANKDAKVPSNSKYIVVGSGISGSLTAFELIEGGVKGEDIVILEAREAASGASSRNAGHVRPGLWHSSLVEYISDFESC
jgi:myosin-crossreactive antigen